MSEKDQTADSGTTGIDPETLPILSLDEDVDFPGQVDASSKTVLGPGNYTIFIPSENAIGSVAEYERVRTLCDELADLKSVGAVTKLGVNSGVWGITFSLDSAGEKLSNAVVKAAFALLNPKLEGSELLKSGFVQDEPPHWRFMDGTKVTKKGNFKKKA